MNQSVIISIVIFVFILSGYIPETEGHMKQTLHFSEICNPQQPEKDIRIVFAECCQPVYERCVKDGTLGKTETVQEMVNRLGDRGYAVVDQHNQVDMRNWDLMESFCRKAENKQEAEEILLVVLNNGGLLQFQFEAIAGNVLVETNSFFWRGNELVHIDKDYFQADTWIYTENGYLFFEKYHMPGFQGPFSHMAVRIKPLDDRLRELNRKYFLPVGYGSNNLFFTEWNDSDYKEINFYDLFDALYPLKYPQDIFLTAGPEGGGIEIPKDRFESVIMEYVPVSSQTLREKTKYVKEKESYEYRPRGLYDSNGGMEAPFPEIIGCNQEGNGRIKLIVNGVWPEMNLDTAFQHEVVVCVRSDGSFYYESNHMLPSQNHVEPIWYTERLTVEE